MRFSLAPQYSRLLLGVFLGFILGTVLYQSQRREWNIRGQGLSTNPCIEEKVSNSCPSGGMDRVLFCYLPTGRPCTVGGASGFCLMGQCQPGSSSLSSSAPLCAVSGGSCGQISIPCSDTDEHNPMSNTPTCSANPDDYCVNNTNCMFSPYITCCDGSQCNMFSGTCPDNSSSSTANFCCNPSTYTCYQSSSSLSSSGCNSSAYNQCISYCPTAPEPTACYNSCATGYPCTGGCTANTLLACQFQCIPSANATTCVQSCMNAAGCTSSNSSSSLTGTACSLGESYCLNNDGSTLCCPSGATCIDSNDDGNYECSGSPPSI
jgi:hypothetical protein